MKRVSKELLLIICFAIGFSFKIFDIPHIPLILDVALAVLVYFSALNIPFDYLHHHHAKNGLKLMAMTFLMNMVFMTFALAYVLHIKNILLAMFFSAVISGVTASNHRIIGYEALLSPAFSILFPVIILEILSAFPFYLYSPGSLLFPMFENILLGIGSGVVFAILSAFISKSIGSIHHFVSIALYFFTETMGASGVVAVFSFGMFLGNVNSKKHRFSLDVIDFALFMVAGYLIYFNDLAIKTALFLFFLFLRFIAIEFTFFNEDLSKKIDLLFLRKKGSTSIAMALLLGSYLINQKIIFSYETGILINLIIYFVILAEIFNYAYIKSYQKFRKDQETIDHL